MLVTARRAPELEALCTEIADGGGVAHPFPADLATEDGINALAALTVDDAVDMLCDAIRRRPDHVGTLLGTAATFGNTVTPGLSRQLLHRFHRAMPDSKAARGGDNG